MSVKNSFLLFPDCLNANIIASATDVLSSNKEALAISIPVKSIINLLSRGTLPSFCHFLLIILSFYFN